MIETIVNTFQLAVGGVCLSYSVVKCLQTKSRGWILLSLFYAEMFLGNVYWQLYQAFYDTIPQFPFVSEFCWNMSFAFLILLVTLYSKGNVSIKKDPVLAFIPMFTLGCAIFYMTFGQIIDNLVIAGLMAALMMRSVYGLKTINGRSPYTGNEADPRAKKLFITILCFCTAEYLTWTASCFFWDDTIKNPYYWFDTLMTITLIFLVPAVKACDSPKYSMLSGEESL